MFNLNGLQYSTVKGRGKNNKTYINIESGFDIESTSTYIDEDEKVAFMYAWVFGIKDENYMFHGRTWEEFLLLCKHLKEYFNLGKDRVLVCYVHNLAFEFQFMRKYFEWEEVFSVDSRKPIKALSSMGIEFRDSLILSGYSLENLAKNLTSHTIEKKVGSLDYSLIRHSETELTEEEWSYIKHDVLIVLYYINEQIAMYGDVARVPLTNTGRVRDFVRRNCYFTDKSHKKSSRNKFLSYKELMEDLQLDEETYNVCRTAFQGGYVHANASKANKVIEDVTSIDFNSSYPAVMVSEKFPMSKPIKVKKGSGFNFKEALKKYNMIFTVRFKDIISSVDYENYISESHCQHIVNPITNNGRVFSADELVMTITEVDFNIIQKVYTWENMQLADVYIFHKGYLPKPIVESVIKLYEDKTTLKGVEGMEAEYQVAKGMLNAVYGMSVTDIAKENNVYEEEWDVKDTDLDAMIESYNDNKKRFLYYPWGVFISAYARRNLWYGITAVGDDYIYSDTDAIKFTNYDKHIKFINKYNELITKKVKAMCEHYNLDYNRLAPMTKEGVRKPIGVWELDGHYSKFKTLGAKRYLVEHKGSQELELTVSGLGKDEGISYLKKQFGSNDEVLEGFDDELHIPADATGKMVHTYIDHLCVMDVVDHNGVEAEVKVKSGVHLENEEFNLSMTDEYIKFINNLKKGYLYTGQKRLS